jgi:hypothetical protein
VTCCRSAKVPFILHFTSWNRITAKWQVAETDRRAKFYTLSRAAGTFLRQSWYGVDIIPRGFGTDEADRSSIRSKAVFSKMTRIDFTRMLMRLSHRVTSVKEAAALEQSRIGQALRASSFALEVPASTINQSAHSR